MARQTIASALFLALAAVGCGPNLRPVIAAPDRAAGGIEGAPSVVAAANPPVFAPTLSPRSPKNTGGRPPSVISDPSVTTPIAIAGPTTLTPETPSTLTPPISATVPSVPSIDSPVAPTTTVTVPSDGSLEIPTILSPDSAGFCRNNVGNDSSNHERRCCTPDTNQAYFTNGATGQPRMCAGQWRSTSDKCRLDMGGDRNGTVWACSAVATAQADLEVPDDQDVTPNDPPAVVRPIAEDRFKLTPTAQRMGNLPTSRYLALQQKWVHDGRTKACNYFITVSMCEAGLCGAQPPIMMAASFDSYLSGKGWVKITLATLKEWFKRERDFEVIVQRDPLPGHDHGHIAIPIGLSTQGLIRLAQGDLNLSANEIVTRDDYYMQHKYGGMKIFVKQ